MFHSLNSTASSLLDDYSATKTKEYIVEIIFLAVISFFGVLGNGLGFAFYTLRSMRNTTTFLLKTLTLNDCLASLVNAFLIYDSTNSFRYPSDILCKIHGFLLHFFTANSMLLLIPLAMDRFACVVIVLSKWKFGITAARVVVVFYFVFSVLIGLPQLLVSSGVEHVVVALPGNITITGHGCMFNFKNGNLSQNVFHIVDIVVICINLLILSVLYGGIAITLKRLSHGFKTDGNPTGRLKNSPVKLFKDLTQCENDSEAVSQQPSQEDSGNPTSPTATTATTATRHEQQTEINSRGRLMRQQRHRDIQLKITLMMFVITVASIISYGGYFYVRIFHNQYDNTLSPELKVLLRTICVNSTLNPYVLGFFSTDFRQFIYEILSFKWLRAKCFRKSTGISQSA